MTGNPRTIYVVALALACGAGAACFEEGPLDFVSGGTTSTLDTAIHADTDPASDTDTDDDDAPAGDIDTTSSLPDSVTTDATAPLDTTGPTDATADADASEVIVGPACLTVSDCDGFAGPDDLCAGTVACVDYRCRVDTSGVVTCDDPGDPCVTNACEPSTGECVTTQICSCSPAGVLPCGVPVTWSTADPGATGVMSSYGCAPSEGPGPERAYTFQVSGPQRVRFSLAGGDGADGAMRVVPYQGDCQASGCLASGADQILFDAGGGQGYAVVIEEGALPGRTLTLTADCGIIQETRCNDGLDDDGDGQTDCDDLDCDGIGTCIRPPDSEVGLCFNGLDDDLDGDTDCQDDDCWGESACLQTCQVSSLVVGCNFGQGATTGGGHPRATDYSCGPAAGSKEIVYRFVAPGSGQVTVTMNSGATPLGLYLLEERGAGCTPLHCLDYGPNLVTFNAVSGKTYYFSIDGPCVPMGDPPTETCLTANFNIAVDCAFQ